MCGLQQAYPGQLFPAAVHLRTVFHHVFTFSSLIFVLISTCGGACPRHEAPPPSHHHCHPLFDASEAAPLNKSSGAAKRSSALRRPSAQDVRQPRARLLRRGRVHAAPGPGACGRPRTPARVAPAGAAGSGEGVRHASRSSALLPTTSLSHQPQMEPSAASQLSVFIFNEIWMNLRCKLQSSEAALLNRNSRLLLLLLLLLPGNIQYSIVQLCLGAEHKSTHFISPHPVVSLSCSGISVHTLRHLFCVCVCVCVRLGGFSSV